MAIPYLPPDEGLLPKWLFFVAVISLANSIQSYATLHYTQRIYSLTTVTPVQGRTFGTWTLLTGLVRAFAAYHITEPAWYQLAMATYVVAGVHFYSEWLYFRTARWGSPLAGPAIISVGSLAWMVSQWGWYVR